MSDVDEYELRRAVESAVKEAIEAEEARLYGLAWPAVIREMVVASLIAGHMALQKATQQSAEE